MIAEISGGEWATIIAIYLSAIGVFGIMLKLFSGKKDCVTKGECENEKMHIMKEFSLKQKSATMIILQEMRHMRALITGQPVENIKEDDVVL